MNKMTKAVSVCASALVASSLFVTGNGQSLQNVLASSQRPSKAVELKMYLIGSPAKDYDLMLTQLNKKIKADLNATLKINWIGWGDFGTKYPLVLASGEPIDLIYTSTWLNFYQKAQAGAFMPLEKIGPKYAPKSFKEEPKAALKQATVNGHLYALPPNYTAYNTYGIIVRGDLMKKYGISKIKTLDDYGKYLGAVAKNNKAMDPAGMYSTQTPIDGIYFFQQDLYPLSGDVATNSPFWININDPKGKVINVVDKPDMLSFLKKMKSWSDKGYWPKSVLSNKDNNMLKEGKAASLIHNMDNWVQNSIQHPEWNLQFTNMITHSYPLPYIQDGMAIPTTAKNPERALMLLEKFRNDQSYYNLFTYGVEGKHFKITSDDQLKPLDQDGFTADQYCAWGVRETKFRKDLVGSPSTLKQVRADLKANSKENIYTNFSVNLEPVKNEYAAVLSVMQQYYLPLKLGYVDPVKGLATLKQQLEAAGVKKVQAEFQKQLDKFRKSYK